LPHYKVNYIVLFVVAVTVASFRDAYHRVPRTIVLMILLQVIIWILYSVFYFDASYLTRVFILLITFSMLGIQLSYNDKREFIRLYILWLVLQSVAGFLGFWLVLSNLLSPISQFTEMDGRPGSCFGLFTTNAVFENYIRNAGFYDEPGSLACWGIFALLFNKLFVHSRIMEFLLLASLTLTFSMAYFIQASFYLFLFYRSRVKFIMVVVVIFALFLIGLSSLNEDIDAAIFGRFLLDQDSGTLQGDNRSDLMSGAWKIFISSPIVGVGATNLMLFSGNVGFVGANFFENLASDGLLGSLVTYVPLFFLLYLGKYRREYAYSFIVLLLGYLQRPYSDTLLLYPLLQYTIILFAYLDVRNNYFKFVQ